jgi:hypothetical protein
MACLSGILPPDDTEATLGFQIGLGALPAIRVRVPVVYFLERKPAVLQVPMV